MLRGSTESREVVPAPGEGNFGCGGLDLNEVAVRAGVSCVDLEYTGIAPEERVIDELAVFEVDARFTGGDRKLPRADSGSSRSPRARRAR